MKHALLALGLISLPILALAEDNTVVVTASRYEQPITNTLAAVTVLTEDDIERYGDDSLADLLSRLAGITIKPSGSLGSTQSLLMRGSATNQIIVLIDGVRSGSATTGSATINAIPLSSIKRIEVVRGPISSLYGADGVGGVIQIFTHEPNEIGNDIELRAEYGSYNFRNIGTGFRVQTSNIMASANLNYLATDGFDSTTLSSNGNEDRDGFEQWSGDLNVESQITDSLVLGAIHNQSRGIAEYDDASCTSNCSDTLSTTNLMSSQLHLAYDLNPSWSLLTEFGRHLDDSEAEDSFPGTFTTERLTFNVSAQHKLDSGFSAILGTDGYQDSVESTTNYEEDSRNNLAVYAQTQLESGDHRLQAGLRVDENSAYGTNVTGNTAFSTFIFRDIEAIISHGTAFKAPSFNDLYYPGYANPDLKPEESETVEVSVRQISNHGTWRLSAYHTKVKNLIQESNNKDSILKGVEAEWSQQLGSYNIALALAYLDARDDDNDRLADRPQWSGSAFLARQFGRFGVDLDVQAENGRTSGDEDLDGFVLIGLGGEYNLTNESQLFANVDNIFDVDYVLNHDGYNNFDYNTPGRTFKVGIEYHL
ncbi:hypothetical protein BGP77_00785 [Saccharospirillum sp. MSK14-1]|uniref:TonB-dependent receptor domain-containing protein n=1 Tax=Saccharospirillum sp. MSK14-1 TaxID=1897632 RepID=UPI000D3B99C1|nr:TonB-dependent receptor [Saccharospirillum sp. MSK14-1]PTY35896.1 hypothetical protein BGP77_00785 [Saccharospirillum sp. MSK14-1]